jgi:hypothetical protein
MRILRHALVGAILVLAPVSSLYADPILATYTFTGSPGDQIGEAVDADPVGALFSDIVRGPGLVANAGMHSINSRAWSQGVLDPNDYYAFSVTADAGYAVSLSQIDFTERRSGTGILTLDVRSSLDGFTSSLYLQAVPDDTHNRRHSILLGSEFAALTVPVEFRFFGYAAEGSLGTWRLGESQDDSPSTLPPNLQVSGIIATVPEPSSLLLFATAATGVLMVRRRKKGPNSVCIRPEPRSLALDLPVDFRTS